MNKILLLIWFGIECMILSMNQGFAQEQQSGSIKGKIDIAASSRPDIVSRGSRSHAYGMSGMSQPTEPVVPEYSNMVVYLKGKDLKHRNFPSATKTLMDQRNAEFVPHVLTIQRGAVVEFVNRDNTYHNVFSLSPTKKFNIGRRPTGENVPVQFDKEGIVQIFCDIHSHMSAYIIVLDSPYFAQPDDHGNYSLENIPPGTYIIKVWHERLTNQERTITIAPGAHLIENFTME
jgi:plastocyanin